MTNIQHNMVSDNLSIMGELENMATRADVQQRLLAGTTRRGLPEEECVSAGIDSTRENKYYLDAMAPMVKVAATAELPSQPMVVSAHPVNPKGLKGFVLRSGYNAKVAGRAVAAQVHNLWDVGLICARTAGEVCLEGAKLCAQGAACLSQGAVRATVAALWGAARVCAEVAQNVWHRVCTLRVQSGAQWADVAGADVERSADADAYAAYMRRRSVAEE